MFGCKARESMGHAAHFSYAAVKYDERNAADVRFATFWQPIKKGC